MKQGCQTCLRVLDNKFAAYNFDQMCSGPNSISIKDKLANCIPDLMPNSLPDAVICQSCFAKLTLMYEFKQKCLETRNKICRYLQQRIATQNTKIDVGQIALHYRRIRNTPDASSIGTDNFVDIATSTEVTKSTKQMVVKCELLPFTAIQNNSDAKKGAVDKLKTLQDIKPDELLYTKVDVEAAEDAKVFNGAANIKTEVVTEGEDFQTMSDEINLMYGMSPPAYNQIDSEETDQMPQHHCPLCEYSCLDSCRFRLHMIIHKTEALPYQCDECPAHFALRDEVLDHLAVHTNEKPYSCSYCDYCAPSSADMLLHRTFHNDTPRRVLTCKLCDFKCFNVVKLRFHNGKKHDSRNPTEKVTYTCSFCLTQFTNRRAKQWHTKKKHRKCNVCNETFTTPFLLKEHICRGSN